MKGTYWIFTGALFLAACVLLWACLNLALENDGWRQVAEGHNRSVRALLKYAEIATKCDVSPDDVAKALGTTVQPSRDATQASQVAQLAFRAEFEAGQIRMLEITDVGKASLCKR
jgi:hypothetical protein